ncbi:hypothetical protein V8F06_005196 [Rhypophila decipiens]
MELTPLQAIQRPYSLISSDALLGPQNPQDGMGTKVVAAKRQRTMYGPRPATEDLQILFEYPYESGAFWSPIPRFTTYNIRPGSAKVFQAVEQGNLEELLRMLWAGEASLRDQDPQGRTLLFYGNKEPQMVRFLLDHSADGDHVARMFGWDDPKYPRTTTLSCYRNYYEAEEEEVGPIVHCLEMLLQAGGDPTWEDPGYDPADRLMQPVLHSIFQAGVLRVMQVAFECSDGLLTSSTMVDNDYDRTGFLSYCAGHYGNSKYSVEALSLLFSRGADVNDLDCMGNTCLHLLLDDIHHEYSFRRTLSDDSLSATEYLKQVRRAAVYLINRGADIFAVNDEGDSVSDRAYSGDPVRGYLWDIILADCGHDIATMRKGCGSIGRLRRYHATKTRLRHTLGEGFTLDVFIKLWEENERLCPYYEKIMHFGLAEKIYEGDGGEEEDEMEEEDLDSDIDEEDE